MKRVTREVSVGGVKIGGRNNPIAVQSMTTCDTRDIETTVAEIIGLEEVGCEIIRVAVPDMAAADALGEIKRRIVEKRRPENDRVFWQIRPQPMAQAYRSERPPCWTMPCPPHRY